MFLAAGARRATTAVAVGPQRASVLRCTSLFSTSTPAAAGADDGDASSDSAGASASSGFRPRRRVPRTYRPLQARPKPKARRGPPNESDTLFGQAVERELGSDARRPSTDLERTYGLDAAHALRSIARGKERGGSPDIEAQLRAVDYLTAPSGSTEDMGGERRAAMDSWTEEERREFTETLDRLIEEERVRGLKLTSVDTEDDNMSRNKGEVPQDARIDPNQRAFGQWGETIVRVDRVQKVQRGGTMVRYRCLVVGGNANGCAGFGIGKASSPAEATQVAIRMCKRNIFFVDRYMGSGLSSDLVGKHNSCRVLLRSVQPNIGLKGHDLVTLILTYFGITDCSAKTHGNRNIYNVVRATFKAICTHESLEEIALKRGKRLLNLERAKRLQI